MTAFCVTIVKNASIDVLRHSQQSVHLDRWDCVSDETPMTSQTSVFTMPMCVS